MDDEKRADEPQLDTDEEDTEGHSLSMNPTIADQLSRARTGELERDARRRSLEREAREGQRRGR